MTVTSKFSTGSGFEASGAVECKVLARPAGSAGLSTPAVEVALGGSNISFNSNSPNLIVLPYAEAKRLRNDGLVDF